MLKWGGEGGEFPVFLSRRKRKYFQKILIDFIDMKISTMVEIN
jgi:hypothetical protein